MAEATATVEAAAVSVAEGVETAATPVVAAAMAGAVAAGETALYGAGAETRRPTDRRGGPRNGETSSSGAPGARASDTRRECAH